MLVPGFHVVVKSFRKKSDAVFNSLPYGGMKEGSRHVQTLPYKLLSKHSDPKANAIRGVASRKPYFQSFTNANPRRQRKRNAI